MKIIHLEKIEITPNNGGICLSVNGEKIDLKNSTEIIIRPLERAKADEDVLFELDIKKRICYFEDYDFNLKQERIRRGQITDI